MSDEKEGESKFSFINIPKGEFSKPACKLIDAVRPIIGDYMDPDKIRERGKAKAEVTVIKAEAEAESREILARAEIRLITQQIRKQSNIESVINNAGQILQDEAFSEEPEDVDEDWTSQFFSLCEDVSDKEMQSLWGKMLAGEVAKPGSFSPKTLQTVKILRKEDAHLFTKYCCLLFVSNGVYTHFTLDSNDEFANENEMRLSQSIHLRDLGLVSSESLTYAKETKAVNVNYYGKKYKLNMPSPFPRLGLPFFFEELSQVGRELAPICGSEPNYKYMEKVVEIFKGQGISIEMINDDSA